MPKFQRIMNDSLEEAKAIFEWVTKREDKNPITVLVGGWAVYTYNPYYGSLDIDLVTNNRIKNSLQQYLIGSRGYERRREPLSDIKYICKDFATHGVVEIDFGSREGFNNFEGREEELPLSLISDFTEFRSLERLEVPVPTRSFLLLMKMKAAWDRNWRLNNNRSRDPGWERGKLIKDYSDILALIDPKNGGTALDLNLLGSQINRLSFLKDVLERTIRSIDAAKKYEVSIEYAGSIIDGLTDLIY
jgi:hypothetical protein